MSRHRRCVVQRGTCKRHVIDGIVACFIYADGFTCNNAEPLLRSARAKPWPTSSARTASALLAPSECGRAGNINSFANPQPNSSESFSVYVSTKSMLPSDAMESANNRPSSNAGSGVVNCRKLGSVLHQPRCSRRTFIAPARNTQSRRGDVQHYFAGKHRKPLGDNFEMINQRFICVFIFRLC